MYNVVARHRVAPEKPESHRPGFALYLVENNTREVFMNEIIKICHIHGKLTKEQTFLKKHPDGCYIQCIQCRREQSNRTYLRNKENRLKEAALYREENRERLAIWARNDRAANKEKYAGYHSRYRLRRFKELLKRYNLTLDDYNLLLKKQKNKCAICKCPETRREPNSEKICRLCIDHCHSTKKVRGLLCSACNSALGKFKENPKLLKSAIGYLRKHSKESQT